MHKKLYGLDHLRAFAICFVFLFHYQLFECPEWLPNIAKFGWTGVDLFFVLSGFLISSQLFFQIKNDVRISFKDFFLKRFFRILPLFWFITGVYFLIPLFREREALPPIWKLLTFTQNFDLNLRDFGTFSHAWSLCVEEHFYFLLPIALILLQKYKQFHKSYWVLIGLFTFGFIIRFYSWKILYLPHIADENAWLFWQKYIYYPTYNRLDGLLTGVSIAAIYQFMPALWNVISKYGNHFLIVSLITLVIAYFLCYEEHSFYASIFGFTLVGIGYGFMVIGAISPTSFLYQINSKITTFIATLSYGIYLIHKGIIHITQLILSYFGFDSSSTLSLIICIISCIAIAFILHQIIEKPFMKLRTKWVA
ncbi:acyltransferase [Flavobacterium sp. ov086]|uniref:acyltransferase family protein n=1 Tax=Flavobacterium sp. ov086 TaxID=1761785 RepID=UPI000B65C3A3|nr:acyltransferase [Flavobacterium sp. ov086]SNR57831.1 Peptidoglycan/LPS O-acetylase OafA/YrhL, contains acyltransferase and SGNH-hydrolase domains [Flavobacterium sp. ov086]